MPSCLVQHVLSSPLSWLPSAPASLITQLFGSTIPSRGNRTGMQNDPGDATLAGRLARAITPRSMAWPAGCDAGRPRGRLTLLPFLPSDKGVGRWPCDGLALARVLSVFCDGRTLARVLVFGDDLAVSRVKVHLGDVLLLPSVASGDAALLSKLLFDFATTWAVSQITHVQTTIAARHHIRLD